MSQPAAFRATIHGMRTVPTRKVCQLTVEFPIEQLAHVAQIAEHGAWVGIARLQDGKEGEVHQAGSVSEREQPGRNKTTPRQDQSVGVPAGADKPKRKFDDMSPAQQAGIWCNSEAFRRFLREKFLATWNCCYSQGPSNVEIAATVVRELCQVDSRAEIKPDSTEWLSLKLAYQLWQNHPELEDA